MNIDKVVNVFLIAISGGRCCPCEKSEEVMDTWQILLLLALSACFVWTVFQMISSDESI